ncbi:uncharacterized protein LOC130980562 [Arachis stenosperma]|uniref:uncharacterized protein LOC130980562 n=1 Tax=Arachis stenosperma TaxID=217475 RepID=UPI0025ACFDEE|nr:uncharacterized protein LOC130980562 [Arachis stenosperma]
MEKYFKRKLPLESEVTLLVSSTKKKFLEFNVKSLVANPGQRPKISNYDPNDRDEVRRAYLQKGPCQPREHDFSQIYFGTSLRRFNADWFDEFDNWLEYSISKDAAFCLCCYLMKPDGASGDAFLKEDFSNWKKKERLQTHVGNHDSAHNQARRKCEALMKQKQHIEVIFQKHSDQAKRDYRTHLTATIECITFLLRQGLILKENACAFYVHCFAHQLQLALVVVAKKQVEIALLFNLLASLCNIVGASCKRKDMLCESQMQKTIVALQNGDVSSGRGLNKKTTLKRASDTRWGSHYGTILSLISIFSSVVEVFEVIEEDENNPEQRAEACQLLNHIQSFEFVFNLHLMKIILGVTNELSQALQRNDQDIINAMTLVKVSKQQLQSIRDDGWSSLLNEVSLFCDSHNILAPNMNDIFVTQGRSRRKIQKVSNLHHF